MKFALIILFSFFTANPAFAQVVEPATSVMEQQLENITEKNADNETEDDSYLQQLQHFLKHPLNLNTADEAALNDLIILNPLQIQQLIIYRKLLGPLISIYELQAIPLWNNVLIQKIRPYITVNTTTRLSANFIERFKNGEHSVLVRVSQVLERSKGYLMDTARATNVYPGSAQKILLRYNYTYKQLLQFGLLAEKDAGEQFFKDRQKQGFDFYSFHLFARNAGIIKQLALGDFTINMGQGLIQWQSLSFKKSTDVMNIKRQAAIFGPYHSAGEINFHRGAGITLAKNKWEASIFVSYKKIDANLVTDTLPGSSIFVSSLQTSGYHRTNSEAADKAVQHQLAYGGNLNYHNRHWHLSINTIQYKFKLPLNRADDPYNKYAFSGNKLASYSLDYSYTFKNIHFFGETACNDHLNFALLNGLLVAVSSDVDMSLIYRNIAKSYQSLYSSAFTENTYPSNEKGIYVGITVRPNKFWNINAYVDYYSFPWLKYRVDMPSNGSDFLIQASFKPNKQLEIYSRYHIETRAINVNPELFTLASVTDQPRQNWRTQVNYKISPFITIRNRTELLWFDRRGLFSEQGFLIYFDLLFNPLLKPFSGNLRIQYFETEGYNSRLYAYENDVLYNYSIPVFYDNGHKYYINVNYDINKRLTIYARWSQTIFRNKSLIGSGLDEIKGNIRSEFRFQAIYIF